MAQRQYSLLRAANLLTPDMITEFETLEQLVQEEKAEPGAKAPGPHGPAGGASLELCSESSESHPCSGLASASRCHLQGPAAAKRWPGPQMMGSTVFGSWAPGIMDFYIQRGPRSHCRPEELGAPACL